LSGERALHLFRICCRAWEPASEQKARADFRRRLLPTRAELERSLATDGVLIIEPDGAATLNLVNSSPASGSGTATSTTVGHALCDGREVEGRAIARCA